MARIPKLHSVVVGNIGTVYAGDSFSAAKWHYSEYVVQSKDNYGRAAGEDVTWFTDGEIHKEYIGSIALAEDEEDKQEYARFLQESYIPPIGYIQESYIP